MESPSARCGSGCMLTAIPGGIAEMLSICCVQAHQECGNAGDMA